MSNHEDEYEPTSDAIVTFPDAIRWAHELIPSDPALLWREIYEQEPAIAGLIMNQCCRLRQRLHRAGASDAHIATAIRALQTASLLTVEVTRRGYRKFMTETE